MPPVPLVRQRQARVYFTRRCKGSSEGCIHIIVFRHVSTLSARITHHTQKLLKPVKKNRAWRDLSMSFIPSRIEYIMFGEIIMVEMVTVSGLFIFGLKECMRTH